VIEVPEARTCTKTGVRLVPAGGALVYRVAQDKYTLRSGPLSSPVNKVVGPLPDVEGVAESSTTPSQPSAAGVPLLTSSDATGETGPRRPSSPSTCADGSQPVDSA